MFSNPVDPFTYPIWHAPLYIYIFLRFFFIYKTIGHHTLFIIDKNSKVLTFPSCHFSISTLPIRGSWRDPLNWSEEERLTWIVQVEVVSENLRCSHLLQDGVHLGGIHEGPCIGWGRTLLRIMQVVDASAELYPSLIRS